MSVRELKNADLHPKRPQGMYKEAIPLLERALGIRVEKLGVHHPDTVSTQNALDTGNMKVRAQLVRLVG